MERDPWLGVELRHLAALAAIGKAGSFRIAAEELGYVQSAVSQQLARLERIVGLRLVERERGRPGVELTSAGRALVEHADAIAARLAAARADLERVATGGGALQVGAGESAATLVLPRLLALLREREPRTAVVVRELDSWQAGRDLVASGELDVAFDFLPLGDGPFEHVELLRSPCALVVQADSPLTRRSEPPTLAEIAGLPLVEHPAWRFSARLQVILEANGRAPRYSARSNLSGAVQSLVGAGVGAAVLPLMAVDRMRSDIEAIDLTGILPPARLALFWHRDRRQQRLLELADIAREACAGISDRWASGERQPAADGERALVTPPRFAAA